MEGITSTMSLLATSAVRGSPVMEIKLPKWLKTSRSKHVRSGGGRTEEPDFVFIT
jgi:hypothetical protein